MKGSKPKALLDQWGPKAPRKDWKDRRQVIERYSSQEDRECSDIKSMDLWQHLLSNSFMCLRAEFVWASIKLRFLDDS